MRGPHQLLHEPSPLPRARHRGCHPSSVPTVEFDSGAEMQPSRAAWFPRQSVDIGLQGCRWRLDTGSCPVGAARSALTPIPQTVTADSPLCSQSHQLLPAGSPLCCHPHILPVASSLQKTGSCLLLFSPSLRASSAIWEARCRDEGGAVGRPGAKACLQGPGCPCRVIVGQLGQDSAGPFSHTEPCWVRQAAFTGAERQACVKVAALGSVAIKRCLQGGKPIHPHGPMA